MEEQKPKENYTFASNEPTKKIQLTHTIISYIQSSTQNSIYISITFHIHVCVYEYYTFY
jgi:hypothetical protein